MLSKLAGSLLGTKNERELKRIQKQVNAINALEPSVTALTDEQLKQKTGEFRERYNKGESLEKLLPEAFAVCREASQRVTGMRHYDVQLIGGIVLHEGKIAEMRTGEGKTLMATLPMYLNAISGKGVHIVTVNEYLAARDADLNRPLFEALGMTVGNIYSMQGGEEKKAAYDADITYGTNNEFGFDYLRDNMVFSLDEKKQRGLNFAIVDEVDSILIDEARTPLIISGQANDSSVLYAQINTIIPELQRQAEEKVPDGGHFWVDEKQRSVEITEAGYELIEKKLIDMGLLAEGESLYSPARLNLVHHVMAAVRAHHLFLKDVHYIVRDGEVIIVDEHTGRTMQGRRWSEGLHQAVEAKEGVNIQNENQTLATTTFQNYFRLYSKLGGMTGTADTEATEFRQIYGLDVIVIPTHRPMIRQDQNDVVYLTRDGKYNAVIDEIKRIQEIGAPILVGTATIEASEHLSNLLTKEGIFHEVLNAKQHEREAEIIAQAGRAGAVTIATNMAGRGTDIILGGNWRAKLEKIENHTPEDEHQLRQEWEENHQKVVDAGGLHIIGSERHESRRIDNQLRGRAGRQGDPGFSRFFLSLEDDLMRIFAGDRVVNMMRAMGLKEDEAIEHRMVTRSIENAQRKVEERNYEIRKNLLKYDDVANEQRKIIYSQRDHVLGNDQLEPSIRHMQAEVLDSVIDTFIPPGSVDDQWDSEGLERALKEDFDLDMPVTQWLSEDRRLDEEGLHRKIKEVAAVAETERRAKLNPEFALALDRHFLLQSLDKHWKDHLGAMDHLRQGIYLRGYAQKNPEQEYKKEAYSLFQTLLGSIKSDVIQEMSKLPDFEEADVEEIEAQQRLEAQATELQYAHQELDLQGKTFNDPSLEQLNASHQTLADATSADPYAHMNLNRNAACPCGSGLKYKQCHGKLV